MESRDCIAIFFFVFFFKQNTAYEMRISDWSSDVCSSDLLEQIGGGQAVGGRFESETREGPVDDVGQHREVIEDEGEDADVEDFPDQPAEDVGLAVHGPEQAGQRDVDGDADGGEKRDVAGQQPEPAIDVRSEAHTSELQSPMRTSYAVFCLKKTSKQQSTIY